ncbi:MAG: diadenylate cyclase CdaA [Clostridiales bacterium]|nr:diadenylate cyclase CdaA [Clostridiales bacterium]
MAEFFQNIWQSIVSLFTVQITIWDILDIILVAVLLYMLLKITRQNRAYMVLKGLGILLAVAVVTSWLRLSVISWLMSTLLQWGVLIVLVLFQPELRRALEQIGRGKLFDLSGKQKSDMEESNRIIEEMLRMMQNLSKRKVGALIIIEQNSDLTDIIHTGTLLDASISSMLLENIFEPGTPLHDGAVIIKGTRIVSAGCFLPLSENNHVDRKLGTRHRAALGMSERSDAVSLIVSEETGVISYAQDGNLHRYVDSRSLRELLEKLYAPKPVKRSAEKLETLLRSLFKTEKEDVNKQGGEPDGKGE